MSVLDGILVVIRWGHALAAVAWVGGSIFYVLVLRSSLKRTTASGETYQAIGTEFRSLVNTAIAVLLVSGIILSVSRLTSDAVTTPYVAVLAAKVTLALYMFYVVRFLRHRPYEEESNAGSGWWPRAKRLFTSTNAVLIIGVLVFGLADVLDMLFERGLVK